MITVRLRLFAELRRFAPDGREEQVVRLPAGSRVADAIAHFGVRPQERLIIGLNGALAEPDAELHDGDEVTLVTAMAGGAPPSTIRPAGAARRRRAGARGGRSFVIEPARFPLEGINQIGMVVRDLQGTMERFYQRFNVGGWRVYTYGPPLVKEMTYRGRRQDYRMRIAITYVGSLMLELIQSLEGPNIYEEFLAAGREGQHHLGIVVPEFDEGVRRFQALGYELIQSGRGFGADGSGGYAYFDTVAAVGTILEVIEFPRQRVPPEAIYPPEG